MSTCNCPTILADCIGVNSPVTGLSSLAPDVCYFYASCCPGSDAYAPPILAGVVFTSSCNCTTLGATTQAEADALAAAACGGLAGAASAPPGQDSIKPLYPFMCLNISATDPPTYVVSGTEETLDWTFSGLMPPGMSLAKQSNNSVELVGTPSDAGNFNFSITAALTQNPGLTVQVDDVLQVLGIVNAPMLIDPNADTGWSVRLPSAVCGTYYGQTIRTSGGTNPITFKATTGNVDQLPSWLMLSSDGIVAGTPPDTVVQTDVYFDVEMTDANGNSCVQTLRFFVECSILQPPDALVCIPYSERLTGCPAAHPLSWSAVGIIPQGFYLATDGTLSGTSTVNGPITFEAQFMTDHGLCIKPVTLNVTGKMVYYNIYVDVYYYGNNESGYGFDLSNGYPPHSGDTVTTYPAGFTRTTGHVQTTANLCTAAGPLFDTGYIPLEDKGPYYGAYSYTLP